MGQLLVGTALVVLGLSLFIKGLEIIRSGNKFYSSLLTESILNISSVEVKQETNVKLLYLLSEREREVLALVAEGSTNALIGERLGIATRTAKKHRENIRAKLGVNNAVEAARVALRLGLFKA